MFYRMFWFSVAVVAILTSACQDKKASPLTTCAPSGLLDGFATIEPLASGNIKFSTITNANAIPHLGAERGGSFSAVNGDYLIETDKLRLVIQQPSRQFFIGSFGGTPIDLDVQRADGVWHDYLGEITPFLAISYSIDANSVRVLEGTRPGVLVVVVDGPLKPLDFINIQGALDTIVSNFVTGRGTIQLNVPWDLNAGLEATASTYYVFRQGASSFEMHTAICNAGNRILHTTSTDLIDTGGNISAFNSKALLDGQPGFGLQVNLDGVNDPGGIVGFIGESGAYALRLRGPSTFFGYAGIGILAHGTDNLPKFLAQAFLGYDLNTPPDGYYRIVTGDALVISRDIAVGRDYNDLLAAFRQLDGQSQLGTITGLITAGGEPQANFSVAVIASNNSLAALLKTDSEGRYSGQVTAGTYRLVVGLPGAFLGPEKTVTVATGDNNSTDFDLTPLAKLSFAVSGTDPSIASGIVPLPAKISLVCVGGCPTQPSRLFTDVLYDHLPDHLLLQAYVEPSGKVSLMAKRGLLQVDALPIPAGTYDIVISHGPEFSRLIQRRTLAPGQVTTITAVLERVVDSSGWISADLHVHTVNSPDSPVPLLERVISFAAENVDLLVTTDHDFLTDLAPVVADLGLGAYLQTMIGEELTFMDVGHFNGYPLRLDPTQRQGGPLDGAGGSDGPTLTPRQLFDGLSALGSINNPVVQVNHPRSAPFGFFSAIQLDTDTLSTHMQPETFRMDPSAVNSGPNDTGLFADNFHAFEIYNGTIDITPGLNDLFAFLNLGLRKTGVAVSDTHEWYSSEPGIPRSYVYVGTTGDTAGAIDAEKFARAIQVGRVFGSNGPLLNFSVSANGQTAKLGDLLSANSVSASVTLQMPDWINVDTLELFANTANTASRRGDPVTTYPTPLKRQRVIPAMVNLSAGRRTITWELDLAFARDTWLVVVARDDATYGENYPMFPMVINDNELPFAFSNAIFIDADDNGKFDAPGVQGQVQSGVGDLPSLAPNIQPSRATVDAFVRELLRLGQH